MPKQRKYIAGKCTYCDQPAAREFHNENVCMQHYRREHAKYRRKEMGRHELALRSVCVAADAAIKRDPRLAATINAIVPKSVRDEFIEPPKEKPAAKQIPNIEKAVAEFMKEYLKKLDL